MDEIEKQLRQLAEFGLLDVLSTKVDLYVISVHDCVISMNSRDAVLFLAGVNAVLKNIPRTK